jgi:peptidoglycan biosynthesis protein MviN/MurJ (putative lipid II flippase)
MCGVTAASGSTNYLVVSGLASLACGAVMMRVFSLRYGAPGIALAVSAATFLYLGLLAVRLASRIERASASSFLWPAAIVLAGAVGMHVVIVAARHAMPALALVPVSLMFYGVWSIVNRGPLQLKEVFSS